MSGLRWPTRRPFEAQVPALTRSTLLTVMYHPLRDPRCEAIFLVAGDKFGNWDAWYRKAVPLAGERFAQHLAELEAEEQADRR